MPDEIALNSQLRENTWQTISRTRARRTEAASAYWSRTKLGRQIQCIEGATLRSREERRGGAFCGRRRKRTEKISLESLPNDPPAALRCGGADPVYHIRTGSEEEAMPIG